MTRILEDISWNETLSHLGVKHSSTLEFLLVMSKQTQLIPIAIAIDDKRDQNLVWVTATVHFYLDVRFEFPISSMIHFWLLLERLYEFSPLSAEDR